MSIAVDPFGNSVIIPKEIIPYTEIKSHSREAIDSPEKVVEHPALMFTTCKEDMCSPEDLCENHYLRVVSWEDTLLISARKVADEWTAFRCICNPPLEQIKTLLTTTRQLV